MFFNATRSGLRAFFVFLLLSVSVTPLLAATDTPEAKSREALISQAERAMSTGDYVAGVEGYVAAAAAGKSVESARVATLVAYEFGFDQATIEAATRWQSLATDPRDASAYIALAQFRSGDIKRAGVSLIEYLRTSSDFESSCEALTERLEIPTTAKDRAKLAARLVGEFKQSPCLLKLAAGTAYAADDEKGSKRYLERLRAIDAFDNDARLIAMAMLLGEEKADEAFTREDLLLDESATTEQRIRLAFLNARAEENTNAINLLSQLEFESPDDQQITLALAMVNLQAGDVNRSRELFTRLLASGEFTNDALYYLGRFSERDRRDEQAIRLYSQVDYGNYVGAAQQRVAELVAKRDGAQAALDNLQGFVERHPRYGLQLSTVRADLLADAERYDEALAEYDHYLRYREGAQFAMLGRADVLLRAERLDESIEQFRATLKRYPDSANALNALGYTLADRTTRYREAEKLIDKALAMEPDNAAIIDSKGWVLFKRGKLKEAAEYLQKAWDQFRDPEVAAHLGETLWRLGDEEGARAVLQEAWQRFPDDKRLRETLKRLLEAGSATRS